MSTQRFRLALPSNVWFGPGVLDELGTTALALGKRALIVTDPNLATSAAVVGAAKSLRRAGVSYRVFAQAEPEVPLACVERSLEAAEWNKVDVVVGIGGGSCLDLAKLTALRLAHAGPLSRFYGENLVTAPTAPVVLVPTTAGTGSEVSPVAVVHDRAARRKVGISSRFLIADAAIVDPLTTLGCPPKATGFAGIDALAHAVEAYLARERTREVHGARSPVFQVQSG